MLVNEITTEEDKKINQILDNEIYQINNRTKLNKTNDNCSNSINLPKKNNFVNKTIAVLEKTNNKSRTKKLLNFDNNCSINNISRSQDIKKIKVIKETDYQKKYEMIKNEIDKTKAELIKERMKGNEIKKSYKKAEKKEKQYNDLFEENNKILADNEAIYNQIVESEEIRKEQDMLIMSLQLEYDRLKKCFENDNINNNTYEYKEEEKQETYEINLPTKQNGRKEKKICKSGKKNGKPKKLKFQKK